MNIQCICISNYRLACGLLPNCDGPLAASRRPPYPLSPVQFWFHPNSRWSNALH